MYLIYIINNQIKEFHEVQYTTISKETLLITLKSIL